MQFSSKPIKENSCLQYELFKADNAFSLNYLNEENLNHSKESLIYWRENIYSHQKKIIQNNYNLDIQQSLLYQKDNDELQKINPFLLTAFSINFWRSKKTVHNGPAMYFVIDTMNKSQIILYIGETNSADKRWKGDHDCKNYINNYKQSISKNQMENHLDIRFFLDVPKDVKLRRKLEKKLIYLWLPPFNKETRDRWQTTFTNN